MRKKIRLEPPPHIVVFDTNVLWFRDKSVVVNPEFQAFWDTYSSSFPMSLVIPGVVRGELLAQQTGSALRALRNADEHLARVSAVTGRTYSHQVTESRVRKEVERRLDAWLASSSATVVDTPVQTIDWTRVIDDSIWRRPPFSPEEKDDGEKGFRDTMILETLDSVCQQASSNDQIAFVCNDQLLRDAADLRLGQLENYLSHSSLEDLESLIKLTKQNLTKEFVHQILFRARDKFFDRDKRTGLYLSGKVLPKIREQFAEDLAPPHRTSPVELIFKSSPEWVADPHQQDWITQPQFVELQGKDVYLWSSRVTLVQVFHAEKPALLQPARKHVLILEVDVIWSASVKSDARFFKVSLVQIKKKSRTFDIPTSEQIERYRLRRYGFDEAEHDIDTPG